MKNTGVIRKIDELGRIVIPKEIRKNLNIHNGEDVQIYIEADKIILEKYQKMHSIKEVVEKYLNKFSKFYNGVIYVTDKENIISSSDNLRIGEKIGNKIVSFINDRKTYFGNSLINEVNGNSYLFPIIVDADAIGSIILESDKIITENDKNIVEMLNILFTSLMN